MADIWMVRRDGGEEEKACRCTGTGETGKLGGWTLMEGVNGVRGRGCVVRTLI